jgi:hypothetical protein
VNSTAPESSISLPRTRFDRRSHPEHRQCGPESDSGWVGTAHIPAND